jgi:hypothetical protein
MDKGPWFFPTYLLVDGPNEGNPDAENKTGYIESDDFEHDATLYVSGNFRDDAERRKYLEFIAGELNAVSSLRAQLAQANTQLDAAGRENERLRGVCMELRAENALLSSEHDKVMSHLNDFLSGETYTAGEGGGKG